MKSILLAAALAALPIPVLAIHEPAADAVAPATQPAVDPKPLSGQVKGGLEWLVRMQRPDGGWSQGEESVHMRGGQSPEQSAAGEPSNVADTCMAMLALIRAGSTPVAGPHAQPLAKATGFVCGQIEKSDEQSLWITDVRGTRTQSKLGTYVDTYLAALLLGEIKTTLPDGELKDRVGKALDKTVAKIQKNDAGEQGEQGWAVALSRGIRGKAMNKAVAAGAEVDLGYLASANEQARGTVVGGGAGGRAEFAPATDAAGVVLYSAASSVQQLQEAVNADRRIEEQLRDKLNQPTTSPSDRQQIQRKLAEVQENRQKLAAAQAAIVDKIDDAQFVAGFGSNGGEEFLSYWAIGETLVTERDPKFADWDRKMTENLNRVQNDDGSWSGHHCITGKTFCTSAALLVLTVDRTTHATATEVRRR